MKTRAHHLAAALFVTSLMLSTLVWLTATTPVAVATCSNGSSVTLINPPYNATAPTLSGVQSLQAASSGPTTASSLTFMLISPTQNTIGQAVSQSGQWRLDWDTRNIANGPYQLVAIAHFGTATALDCSSPASNIVIQNTATQTPTLTGTISPASWQTLVGTTQTFSVDTLYTDQYGRTTHVTPSAAPYWNTTIGSLTQTATTATLAAGTTAGTGQLSARLYYNGLTAQPSVPIKVALPATNTPGTTTPTTKTPSPTPTPSPSPNTSNKTPAPTAPTSTKALADMPTIFRPDTPTNSAPTVSLPTLSCLEQKLGAARFKVISNGSAQPTLAERRLAANCFSGAEPIPAVLAPIAPTQITNVTQTANVVTLGGIKTTTTTTADGKKISGLLMSGTGAPNSTIYLYIFSDPLVLRAQVDSNGTWTYILQNPLKSGKHEVYAVAEKDAENFVRTPAIPITIAAAEPGKSDGSLVIERSLSPLQISFLIAAGLMLLASMIVLLLIRRFHRAKSIADTDRPKPNLIMPSTP